MFNQIDLLPDDPIFGLNILFSQDTRPEKVNLGIGAYKDEWGNPVVLSSVRKAEQLLLEQKLDKEYPPMEGVVDFIQTSLKLVFGSNHFLLKDKRIAAIQSVGGTGALRIGAEFYKEIASGPVFLSTPTWPNHLQIFRSAGMQVNFYPYYSEETHGFDFDRMCAAIRTMPPKSLIILHACCHNPTGVDPTFEQWKILSELIKEHQLVPFFDFAYQGFGANLEQDAQAIRLFAEEGHEMFVASSYSKNFGLYGERVGTLAIVTPDASTALKVKSHLKQRIRSSYSMPPLHGARIVSTIVQSLSLQQEWLQELEKMRSRIRNIRKAFVNRLSEAYCALDFSFMNEQLGMFSFSGLDEKQVLALRDQYGIYTPLNGRINVAGLNSSNLDYVVQAVSQIVKS
ncbi:amino acid aminotransferase [Parachlamydia acanthamoebae]|uniref:Aminotransferase n=2 Tax=Parachlamydia acanthamoebae TaxID=83552 RepID=F8KV01_PARAV|nr:amino acid aminotransferase [Parachlamydia acanthamoebae]KIA76448.1 Aspartate aminotransferase [Parachlamydia acanthamoebae]CCB85068.1 aspartate aminotransferase [Parachlamydia acanthamoebae UV-7]